jgi:hypothetical protein
MTRTCSTESARAVPVPGIEVGFRGVEVGFSSTGRGVEIG